jgi:triphosphoribosyl-dephospho-CoA synthetase
VFAPDSARTLEILGEAFIARWLSPGGSADLLAAAWFLYELPACVDARGCVAASITPRVPA